jgi:hypothetical protein
VPKQLPTTHVEQEASTNVHLNHTHADGNSGKRNNPYKHDDFPAISFVIHWPHLHLRFFGL